MIDDFEVDLTMVNGDKLIEYETRICLGFSVKKSIAENLNWRPILN